MSRVTTSALRYETLSLYRQYLKAIKQLQHSDAGYVHRRVKQEFYRLGNASEANPQQQTAHLRVSIYHNLPSME
ncbi:hypothetical protein H4R35_007315 [Dimargaris xerosporica]|nr:hypothetical protein H4R35_007315 [Dimargaris xerosporica]